MEDTLRVPEINYKPFSTRLNPCFNGRYSQSTGRIKKSSGRSLNPCFNGRYSQSACKEWLEQHR